MILDSDREQDDGLREEEGDGEVMLEDLPPMNEDEEDLFSSIEGTPWSSQGWADHGMLEEDEAGEELLLGGVSVSPNWEVGTPCWRGTMERLARVEESMCHGSGYGVEGLEDVDVQMLF